MYQALYRTWRPQTFDDVVGQPSVTQTLRSQVDTGRLSHAYLFTGTRGTGKTTCAKILAKAVNCLHPKDGSPCNNCVACKSIDEGTSLDVLEIDAASNNGVDNVRTLRDEAIYTPSELKYRVYIIDEVHMLSTAAFNALLKIIEEPPAHLIFILATTELNKVPATILSRCQRFSFRRLSQEDMAGRINQVAYAENIDIDREAIQLLARLGDGAMRDALSLLDQCSSAADGGLTAQKVYDILGLAGDQKTAQLMDAVANHDTKTALELFGQVYEAGKSIPSVLDELCALARDLLLLKLMPKSAEALLTGACTEAERKALLPRFSPGELTYLIRRLQETASGFAQSVNPRLEAELCLLQLCNPSLRLDADAMNARLSRVEEQLAAGVQLPPAQTPQRMASLALDDDAPWDDDDSLPQPPPSEEEAARQAAPAQPERNDVPASFWPQLVERLKPELKPWVRGFFTVGKVPIDYRLKDDRLTLYADAFCFSKISDPAVLDQVTAKATAILGRPITVRAEQRASQAAASSKADVIAEHWNQLDETGATLKIT